MKVRALPLILAVAALSAPVSALAGTAFTQAHGVVNDPANYDGRQARPQADVVRAGATTDRRTNAQIARDEQLKEDARTRENSPTLGADTELAPPKPNEWLKSDHIIMGVKGALVGLLVGSLWGLTGLGIGILVGGLIGYGLSKLTA